MKKLLLLLLLIIPVKVFALDSIELYSQAHLVYDVTDDKIILNSHENDQRDVASITKIMSSIVVIENVNNLDEKVTITQAMLNTVPWDAFIIHLKAGEEVTYRDLLYGTLLPSGADAVNCMAIATFGSLNAFVEKMNQKAQELGMTNTHYTNPIGMDEPNHYSSASDVLKVMKYALKNEDFKKAFEAKSYTMTNGMTVEASAKTYGDKVGVGTERIIGDKTGYTDPAGFCIAFEFKSHDHLYYAIDLGAPVENFKDFKHIRDANSIIDYVENNYDYVDIVKSGNLYKDITVVDSTIDKYRIEYDKDIRLLLPKDYNKDDIKIVDSLPESISYKNELNEQIGTIKYYYQDDLIYTQDVYLRVKINPNIKEYIKIHFYELIALFFIVIALVLLTIFVIKRHK